MTLETRPPSLEHLAVAVGPRVRVRHKVREDAVDDFRWRTDSENARFDGGAPYGDGFERFLRQFEYDELFGAADKRAFAIETTAGVHIGNVTYYHGDASTASVEFGIGIGHVDYRDAGLGTEATVLFLRYVWANTAYRRVYLHTLEWNERARACFRRAGFDDSARVTREDKAFIRMEARREWWTLWDLEGRFETASPGLSNDARS